MIATLSLQFHVLLNFDPSVCPKMVILPHSVNKMQPIQSLSAYDAAAILRTFIAVPAQALFPSPEKVLKP